MPLAVVVFEKQIEFGTQDEIAGIPENTMIKRLFEAAHQGCTIFTFGTGGEPQYADVSSQPTPRTWIPSGSDL